ncbi:GNAT family N-acetyltransferase [Vibrio phage vB_VpS_PG07]|uniref:GNAT family N-acetyltransferase n=1 Tax=Vibrio phage vB_VpS_PG07 TaxID=2301664 RepID=A0A385E7D3_9CAUD|nr:GNAT family N-acetyltransferase [Vibrio phage vB_VpS_PG07]AXQ66648.1 GNAT family N-acetyltransferase [Vibrio phage vB_VpS_PG07]
MLVKITKDDVVAGLQATLEGTCTYSSYCSTAVEDTCYNFLASYVADHLGGRTPMYKYSDELEKLSKALAHYLDTDDVWDKAYDLWAGSGFSLCKACGWWGEYLNDEPVCDDCVEDNL